jgi:hypothetical protein
MFSSIVYLDDMTTAEWNHFFSALRQYLNTFRREQLPTNIGNLHRGTKSLQISPEELTGLAAWLRLATQIAREVQ